MTTFIHPFLAANAFQFAIQKATNEGKITIAALLILSLFSWTIIITKFRQLWIARKSSKRFYEAYSQTRDPMGIHKKGSEFNGAPAFQLYVRGADEVAYHLKNNPVLVTAVVPHGTGTGETDQFARQTTTKISTASFEATKVVLEEAAAAQAMSLEKGMIVLSTAVAGGPFIGLLGTVWGVMSTFADIAVAQQASLTTMAPGVAAALVATVTGLPVSTTHVLSSGVAGTMVANKSGLQSNTIKKILLAWVLTLPACMLLAGVLFTVGRLFVG